MNSIMMRHLFDLQPESKRLFHFVKLILPCINTYVDGYLLKVLIIIFLQRERFLPSVEMAQANLVPEFIDGIILLF
jgi:hypothetical protein